MVVIHALLLGSYRKSKTLCTSTQKCFKWYICSSNSICWYIENNGSFGLKFCRAEFFFHTVSSFYFLSAAIVCQRIYMHTYKGKLLLLILSPLCFLGPPVHLHRWVSWGGTCRPLSTCSGPGGPSQTCPRSFGHSVCPGPSSPSPPGHPPPTHGQTPCPQHGPPSLEPTVKDAREIFKEWFS